jgi:hypothetical protein
MKNGDVIDFSPNYSFKELSTDIQDQQYDRIISEYKSRINEVYFRPINELINKIGNDEKIWYSFSVLTMELAFFDHLVHLKYNITYSSGDKYKELLQDCQLEDFIYDDYRNGLIHEGIIKNGRYISLSGQGGLNPIEFFKKLQDIFKNTIDNHDKIEFLEWIQKKWENDLDFSIILSH